MIITSIIVLIYKQIELVERSRSDLVCLSLSSRQSEEEMSAFVLAVAGAAGVREEEGAAERAGGLALVDPLVDAGLVEGVRAVAELADAVPRLERAQAHRTDGRGRGRGRGAAGP